MSAAERENRRTREREESCTIGVTEKARERRRPRKRDAASWQKERIGEIGKWDRRKREGKAIGGGGGDRRAKRGRVQRVSERQNAAARGWRERERE